MTTRFISAAEMMCRVLGMPNYEFVAIGHPISSASQETLAEYASATVEQSPALIAARLVIAHSHLLSAQAQSCHGESGIGRGDDHVFLDAVGAAAD